MYRCDSCGREFSTRTGLGGHRGYCRAAKKPVSQSVTYSRDFETSQSVSNDGPLLLTSGEHGLTPAEQQTLQAWSHGALAARPQDYGLVPAPFQPPPILQWVGRNWKLVGIAAVAAALTYYVTRPGGSRHLARSAPKAMPDLMQYLPQTAITLLAYLWLSKLARTEVNGWLKAFEKWGK